MSWRVDCAGPRVLGMDDGPAQRKGMGQGEGALSIPPPPHMFAKLSDGTDRQTDWLCSRAPPPLRVE